MAPRYPEGAPHRVPHRATRVLVMREQVFGEDPPREVLLYLYGDGTIHSAIREAPGASWGPPLAVVSDESADEAGFRL